MCVTKIWIKELHILLRKDCDLCLYLVRGFAHVRRKQIHFLGILGFRKNNILYLYKSITLKIF